MAAINPFARELLLKIVFYGPGLGGKTTTLQNVHDSSKPEHRGKMVSLATAVDRTLYFDFLPIRVPKTRGMSVRLQLFTVPGQVYYNATRKLVLTGVDGLVFVADSQAARLDANLESLENLQDNLREQKRELGDVPHVLQYNKRDLEDVLAIEELEESLNLYRAPSVATIATKGKGVFEALSLITHAVVEAFQKSLPERSPESQVSLSVPEGGLEGALRGAEGPLSTRTVSLVTESLIERGALPPRLTGIPDASEEAPKRVEPAAVAKESESVVPEVETRAPLPHADDDAPPPPTAPPVTVLRPEGTLRDDLGRESSPQGAASVRPRTPNFSFASLWGEGEREVVREVEAAIASREHVRAVELIDQLAARVLASGALLLGTADAPRDAALVPVLLGLSGARYLAFRSLVRDTHAGQEPDERTVLAAYAFVIEMRLSRARIGI